MARRGFPGGGGGRVGEGVGGGGVEGGRLGWEVGLGGSGEVGGEMKA